MECFKIEKKILCEKKNQSTKVNQVFKKKAPFYRNYCFKVCLKPKVCSFAMDFAMLIT
jgi:hypothetical protein